MLDLRAGGLSVEAIAQKIQCSDSLVKQLASGGRGTRLSYSIGAALLLLHSQRHPVPSSSPNT